MKKIFRNALILTFGFGLAATFTACHSSSDDEVKTVAVEITPKHSIRGIILDGNGKSLTGATVKLSRQGATAQNVTVTNNTFTQAGLADGNYEVTITKTGYKEVSATFDLKVTSETINGKATKVAQDIEQVFYLAEEVKSRSVNLGGDAQVTDEIVIETTAQDDGTGNTVNTTDPNGDNSKPNEITVKAQTPSVSGKDYDDIDAQLKAQGSSIENFSFFLTNTTSLEDAKAVAKANGIVKARETRATTALPGGRELLAGVALNAGAYIVDLPSNYLLNITIDLPDDNVGNAVTVFRTINGDSWSELTSQSEGISSIEKTGNKITLKLKTIQSQSFVLGVKINETITTEYEDLTPQTRENTTAQTQTVNSMTYTAKAGMTLTNTVQGIMTEFLRKVVARKNGVKIVKEPETVNLNYVFNPAYQLPATGILHLEGKQKVNNMTISIENGSASATVTAREYKETFVNTYAEIPEDTNTHTGGSN